MDIREARDRCEDIIARAIKEFEDETGLEVRWVDIKHPLTVGANTRLAVMEVILP